jgi:hypothetical protein
MTAGERANRNLESAHYSVAAAEMVSNAAKHKGLESEITFPLHE